MIPAPGKTIDPGPYCLPGLPDSLTEEREKLLQLRQSKKKSAPKAKLRSANKKLIKFSNLPTLLRCQIDKITYRALQNLRTPNPHTPKRIRRWKNLYSVPGFANFATPILFRLLILLGVWGFANFATRGKKILKGFLMFLVPFLRLS